MPTEKECAALSALVWSPPGSHDPDTRMLAMPKGWSKLMETPADPAIPGFLASAYVHGAGDGVIVLRAPDFLSAAFRASSEPEEELLANLALDLGLASFTEPMAQASRLFGHLRQWMLGQGEDPARIVFTGHGVGAGMAAVLAVWFDHPCQVFAQAPLRAVALTPSDFAGARTIVDAMLGPRDAAVQAIEAFIQDSRATLAQREQRRVSHWYVRGEAMERLRLPTTDIRGSEYPIDIGVRPGSVEEAAALHDISLHAALLYEPRLRPLCRHMPDLFPLLTQLQHRPLIAGLLNDQHLQGLDAPAALHRLAADLEEVRRLGATAGSMEAFQATAN